MELSWRVQVTLLSESFRSRSLSLSLFDCEKERIEICLNKNRNTVVCNFVMGKGSYFSVSRQRKFQKKSKHLPNMKAWKIPPDKYSLYEIPLSYLSRYKNSFGESNWRTLSVEISLVEILLGKKYSSVENFAGKKNICR